jgi:glutamate synthase domain-containing protein 2
LTSQARSKHETRSKSKHDVYSSFAGIKPDFITIDGAEGGTGAAPPEFSNSVGFPMIDGLTIANNMLIGAGVRDDIKIICSG